ncbi:odorant-binding protein-like [Pteronotus mesoamericanus]|uniref:odorant-binding protein-like n=1 Tax=Pteronotus mesoamericanus TaxID=1884717 RepID=UPI0023EC14ED|nr:odorant-binding protein-like [Pteronotus parnellii mesoamericanus]
MKVLLLTLVLSLVCADLSTTDLSQLSGEWKTIYVAASDLEKTNENGPFRVFTCAINFDMANDEIILDVFVKINGQCIPLSVTGKRIKGNVFAINYEGKILYEPIYASETSLVAYLINVDENNEVSKVTVMLSKGNHVNEVDFEKYKELTLEKNIPEGNIVDLANLDNCPENENRVFNSQRQLCSGNQTRLLHGT